MNIRNKIVRQGFPIKPGIRFSFFILLLLTSCSSIFTPPTPTVTPSPLPPTSTPTPVPTATLTPSPTPVPAPARAKYTLNTTIDYAGHTVSVDESIVYPNHTGQLLKSLTLAIVPNLWANCFALNSLSIDGAPVTDYTITTQRLDVPLPAQLAPEATTTVSIQYSLALPFAAQVDPNASRPRIFGYTSLQMNLTNWYPFIVPFMNGDWVLHDPWYYGEHLVYDAADFEVDLKFTDLANIPVVASSGMPEGTTSDGAAKYTLTSGRAFIFSVSPQFKVATQQVGDILISSYYFDFYDKPGQAALRAAAEALQIYSQRYGPYPHKTLAVVMGDFNDGMEYSASFFLPRSAYNLYNGTDANLLTTVSVHETAHQWWFEQVANDQALQPWLDEALATYSETIFYETTDPKLLSWWWSYWPGRLQGNYPAQGWVDIPIYAGGGFPTYTATVYLNGVHFLTDLRKRIGDADFFAFLQDYLQQENGRIATASDFFHILSTHTRTDYSDIVHQYFQNAY